MLAERLKPWLLHLWHIAPYDVGRLRLRDLGWMTGAVNDHVKRALHQQQQRQQQLGAHRRR